MNGCCNIRGKDAWDFSCCKFHGKATGENKIFPARMILYVELFFYF
jgi:hypothetical protein